MEVIVAKNSGFCFGVKRAVEMVYSNIDKENVYTYGPVIHNEEVVSDLEKKGVRVLNTLEDIQKAIPGTVIIRAHGIPNEIYDVISKAGHEIVDATCPFVLKIHNIVKKASEEGKTVIIIGDDKHPEVQGIKSCVKSQCFVIDSKAQAYEIIEKIDFDEKKLCVVSQTTFNYNKFKELVEILTKNSYDRVDVLNTICNATEERQSEAASLASSVDAMIVIGGRNSSNTQKLYDICQKVCNNTFYIQKADDMDYAKLCGMSRVGITAGASTPNIIIEEVQKRCQI